MPSGYEDGFSSRHPWSLTSTGATEPVITHRPAKSPSEPADATGGAEVVESDEPDPVDADLDADLQGGAEGAETPAGDAPFFPKTEETKPAGRLPKFLSKRV